MNNYMDLSINPGDDFFKYATGHWIDYNPQLPEYPRWGTFTAINEDNLKKINKIIQKPGNSEIGRKINSYYRIFSNWDKRNEDGVKPLLNYLEKNVYSINSREDLINFLTKKHMRLFFGLYNREDDKNSSMNALWCWQSGLSLGNKEYYLSKDQDKKKIIKAWKKYIISLYKLLGYSNEEALSKYKVIFSTEKKIAKVSYSIEEQQEPSINYHKKNISKLSKTVKFDLNKFISDYGYDASSEIIVAQEKVLKLACKFFNEMPLDDLKTIVEWRIIDDSVCLLGDDVRKILFKFNKVMTGAKKDMPKKKRAINAVNNLFAEAIGQAYVEKYFSEDAKNDVKHLVQTLVESYRDIINEQTWLSYETKELASNKLDTLRIKIGYPDKVEDYSDMPIDENITLFENRLNIYEYFFNKDKEKYYNKPVDKEEWLMSPQNVNAYYNPTTNEICFPAGILQGDFYQYGREAALNYGGIGVVIGHEMTHGYDNHGRQFDADGNMRSWWKDEEVEKFNNLTQNTISHFSEMEVLPGLNGDGTLTLGENLADYGGLKIAYNALLKITNNKEDLQKFFIAYATVWAGVNTEEGIRHQVLNNEHSVNYVRVNGTLPMFTPWYEVFDIKPTDTLYIDLEKRAKIW